MNTTPYRMIPYHFVKRVHSIRVKASDNKLNIISTDALFCLKSLSEGKYEQCRVNGELLMFILELLKKKRPLFCGTSRAIMIDFLQQLSKVHGVKETPITIFDRKELDKLDSESILVV